MSEATEETGTDTENAAGDGMPVAKKWEVDVFETSRRVIVVESFTRSEARQRAKNAAFWIDKGDALEVVKSKPSGQPRELDGDGNVVPPREAPAPRASGAKK